MHESITIIDVVSKGTLDEHVLDIAGMKKEALQDLVRDGARLAALLKGGRGLTGAADTEPTVYETVNEFLSTEEDA